MTSPINNNINRSSTDSVSSSSVGRRDKAPAAKSDETPRPATGDTVSLSAESLQVGELQQQLNDIPEVDAEKVAAIKEAIANGKYPLDPESIAENLMSLEKALTE